MTIDAAAVRKMSMGSVRQRIKQENIAYANAQSCVTRCADCRWYYRGTVGDGKRAFASHRERKHS